MHPGVCPACGIAYAKWPARERGGPRPIGDTEAPDPGEAPDSPARPPPDEAEPALARLRAQLAWIPEDADAPGLWWRVALIVALAGWTLRFASHGLSWEHIGGSFLHGVNLAFHEFGHIAFRPFGEFLTILGGSLFQVLLPLALSGYFLLWRQDTVSAAVALWWCGQNFLDIAPYIADAEYRALPLVGGGGEESHDWGNLLTMLDAIDAAPSLARTSFGLGMALMLIALAWATWLLWRWWRALSEARLR